MSTICVFLSACAGGWSLDDIDEEELDDYVFGMPLDNIKVLRKSYNEQNAAFWAEQNKYYDAYISQVLQYLNSAYGIVNMTQTADNAVQIFTELISSENVVLEEETQAIITKLATDFTNNEDYFKYYYDSLRYQITSETPVYAYVPKWKKDDGGVMTYSNDATCPADYSENTTKFYLADGVPQGLTYDTFVNGSAKTLEYYEVTIDTSYGWNWRLNSELGNASAKANTFFGEYVLIENPTKTGTTITNKIVAEDYSFNSGEHEGLYGYYSGTAYEFDGLEFTQTTYTNTLYGTADPKTEDDLQNVFGNETEMQQALTYVVYCIVNNQTPAEITVDDRDKDGTTFNVEGFSSVLEALDTAKEEYKKKATYVGLTESDQTKIVEYILNNVIGSKAIEQSKKSVNGRYDLYYNELVTAVVKYCTALTATGATLYTEEDQEVIDDPSLLGKIKNQSVIGGQYLSSDIKDYEYNTAFINWDAPGFEEFAHLDEYEFQSMLLMPSRDCKIDDIWIDFGYKGDGLGQNDSITIRTYVRNYLGGGQFDIYSKDITVIEDSVDPGEDGTTLMFDIAELKSGQNELYLKSDIIDFDNAINSLFYQKRVAGLRPLSALKDFSKEIVITGKTEARNYYSLVEGEFRDYGVFNYKILEGTPYYDKCYIEVAFEVISATTDNYKFYCGFMAINEFEEYLNDPEWQ